MLAQAVVEKRHLEFMLDLRKYEEPVDGTIKESDRGAVLFSGFLILWFYFHS